MPHSDWWKVLFKQNILLQFSDSALLPTFLFSAKNCEGITSVTPPNLSIGRSPSYPMEGQAEESHTDMVGGWGRWNTRKGIEGQRRRNERWKTRRRSRSRCGRKGWLRIRMRWHDFFFLLLQDKTPITGSSSESQSHRVMSCWRIRSLPLAPPPLATVALHCTSLHVERGREEGQHGQG